MCTRECQPDVVSEPKGTGMFVPLVGKDPSKARDSRPKPSKKLSSHRACRNRTTAVYMPYQLAAGLTHSQMTYQLVATGVGQRSWVAVANQLTGHMIPPVLGCHRPSSSGHSSSSHSSSVTSCNSAQAPAGHFIWAVNDASLSTQQQTVVQQRNQMVHMHAHSGRPRTMQGMHACAQGATWMAPVSSASTYLPPAPALLHPLPAGAHPVYCPSYAPQVSGVDCSISNGINIWGPVSDQHTPFLMPSQCMPAACSGYSSLTATQPAQAAQLVPGPTAHSHACSAQLLQQRSSSGGCMLAMPASASQQQQQQTPQLLSSSGSISSIGSTGFLEHGMVAMGLQDRGFMLPPVYTCHAAEWLGSPAPQAQHTSQQGQQQQEHLAVPMTGGTVPPAAHNSPLHNVVLCS